MKYLLLFLLLFICSCEDIDPPPNKCYKLTDNQERTEIIKVKNEYLYTFKQCVGLKCNINLDIYKSSDFGAPLIARYNNLAAMDYVQCQ